MRLISKIIINFENTNWDYILIDNLYTKIYNFNKTPVEFYIEHCYEIEIETFSSDGKSINIFKLHLGSYISKYNFTIRDGMLVD